MSLTAIQKPADNYFPMMEPRAPQSQALRFITRAVADGYSDIVIAAPTGVGKTGIGAAACLWGASFEVAGHAPGGYYLVTQKMLQDQLENDFPRFKPQFRTSAGSVKSSSEYPCRQYGTCMAGGMASAAGNKEGGGGGGSRCGQRADKSCPYTVARSRFDVSSVAVTNYPYLFTEHMNVNVLKPRNVMVLDEAHTLDRQITGFVEVTVDKESLDAWAPDCRPVPEMGSPDEFADWLRQTYLITCGNRLDMLGENLQSNGYSNRKMQDEFNRLKNHIGRVNHAVINMASNPGGWVFWQENVEGELKSMAKPVSAAPFVPMLIDEMSAIRIYLSAYMGPKDVFCRSLGLAPDGVAWLDLDSNFDVDSRLIHVTPVGPMSRQHADQTLPKLLKMCEAILEAHPDEKGVIHCHTYQLGQKIYDHFRSSGRMLFSTKASDRAAHFRLHRCNPAPTVMLSPSITEGYSFDDDLARFQIIAKTPYGYLGDRQVAARMKIDPDWYTLQTAQSMVQACGRIVRSATDHGSTYILDSDFVRLYRDSNRFFPKWFKDAVRFYN